MQGKHRFVTHAIALPVDGCAAYWVRTHPGDVADGVVVGFAAAVVAVEAVAVSAPVIAVNTFACLGASLFHRCALALALIQGLTVAETQHAGHGCEV